MTNTQIFDTINATNPVLTVAPIKEETDNINQPRENSLVPPQIPFMPHILIERFICIKFDAQLTVKSAMQKFAPLPDLHFFIMMSQIQKTGHPAR